MANKQTATPDLDQETFQTAFKFAPIGMAFLSLSGKWLRVNRSLCEILGLTEQDLLATTMEALLYPEDAEPVVRYLQNIRDGMILGYQMEVRYRHPQGHLVWVLQSAALIRDADGNQSSLLVQIQDITLRKQAEQALRESEERFRVIFDNSNDGILLADLETKRFIFGNKTICQMLDRSPDEIKDLGVMDIHPPEDLPRIIDQFEKQAKKEIGIAKDLPVKRKGGSIFYADVSSFPITLAGKTYLVGDFRDTTERKLGEEALRQSEERFRVLFEQAADIILLLEIPPGGIPVIRDANSATLRLLGYQRDELIGWPVSVIEAAPDASKVVGERRQNILSGLGTIFEARHRCKDGTIRDFECSVTEMQIGSKTLAISVERDITERKRVEEALKTSEERFHTVAVSLTDVVYEWDLKLKLDWFGDIDRIMGYSAGGFPRSLDGWAATLHPEDKERVWKAVEGQLKGAVPFVVEYRVRKKDGEWRWWSARGTALRDERGEPYKWIGAITDITELKRVEKQARERMEELRAFYSLAELTERESITLDKLYQEITDILPKSWQYPEIACARMVIEDSEFRTENFTESPWRQSAPVKVNGSVVGRVEVGYLEEKPEEDEGPFVKEERLFIDAIAERIGRITERKRAEEKLRKLSRAIEQSPALIVITDLAGNMEYVNPKFTQVTGYSFGEALGQNPRILKSGEMPPEGYERLWKTITSGKEWRGEFRNKKKNGEFYWESASISPVFDSEGAVISFLAVKEDITERKRAEAERDRLIGELQEALAKVKTLSGLLPICASCKKIRDDKGYWNQIEGYIRDHSEAEFSHSICPDCARRLYPEIYEKMMREKEGRP